MGRRILVAVCLGCDSEIWCALADVTDVLTELSPVCERCSGPVLTAGDGTETPPF